MPPFTAIASVPLHYWTSGTCALCLLIVVVALIFHRGFRRDLAAGPNEVNLFGLLSVQGGIVVVMCALLVFGLLYPLSRSRERPAPSDRLPEFLSKLPFPVANEGSALEEIRRLYNHQTGPAVDVEAMVRELSPEHPVSQRLRQFVAERVGPWALASSARPILVSVAGRMKSDEVRGCQEYFGRRVELRSNYVLDGQLVEGDSPLIVTVNAMMSSATNCRETVPVDLQLSCDIARRLFSERILSCDQQGEARWRVRDRKLPAFATKLLAPTAADPAPPTAAGLSPSATARR
jgi:hypothetical protein